MHIIFRQATRLRASSPKRATPLGVLALLLVPAGVALGQVALTLENTQSLSFGSFAASSSGTVELASNGGRSATGGVILVSSNGGHAAKFSVSGDPYATYTIELPGDAGAVVLPGDSSVVLTGPGADMPLTGFNSQPSGEGQLDGAGSQVLSVGATLHVGDGQASGSYSGSFTVTVNYN